MRNLRHGWLRSVEVPRLTSSGWAGSISRIFSRDGTRLAAIVEYPGDSPSQSGFGLLALFNCFTGREFFAPLDPFPDLQVLGNQFLCLTMSNNGKRLAVAVHGESSDSTDERLRRISIRDGDTGREIRSIESSGLVSEIALSPDGSRLVADNLGQITIWDTSTGELVQTLPTLPLQESPRVAFCRTLWSPDGTQLLRQTCTSEPVPNESVPNEAFAGTGKYRALFQILNAASGEALWEREFPGLEFPMLAGGWSPDGKLVVVIERSLTGSAKPNVQLWDSSTGTTLAILDGEASSPFMGIPAFSFDGQLLAAFSLNEKICVWEVSQLPLAVGSGPLQIAAPHLALQTTCNEIYGLAFRANNHELQSVDRGSSITSWNAASRGDTGPGGLGPTAGVKFAEISNDASKVAFCTRATNPTASIWELARNEEECELRDIGGTPGYPIFSPDGRRIALAVSTNNPNEALQIGIHDAISGEKLHAIQVDNTDSTFRSFNVLPFFRPDGKQIAAVIAPHWRYANQEPARLIAWETETGKQLFSVTINGKFPGLFGYSLDGASLLVGTFDPNANAIEFYDATTGEKQKSIPVPSSKGLLIDVRSQIYGAVVGTDVILWNMATGEELVRLPGYNRISKYAFSPDGNRLVLHQFPRDLFGENELTLWSVKSGRRLLTLKREGMVEALSFSPDGNRLVVVHKLKNPETGKSIQVYDATPLPDETETK